MRTIELTPESPITRLIVDTTVGMAREIFVGRYLPAEFPSLSWDNAEWVLNPANAPTADNVKMTAFFRALDDSPPMPKDFADVVKAHIVWREMGPDNACMHARAARHLWAAISERIGRASFSWDDVVSRDFQLAQDRAGHGVTGQKLGALLRWLKRMEIVEGVQWSPKAQVTSVTMLLTEEGRRARLDRLPTRRAVTGLADIYWLHANEVADRILICAVGLLLATGLRSKELLTLPVDCWIEGMHRGRNRFGIRFWNMKEGGRTREIRVRWLSPMGADLARRLLDELFELTKGARARAIEIETALNEGRSIAMPWGDRTRLSLHEAATALGYKSARSLSSTIWQGLVDLTPGYVTQRVPKVLCVRRDVEAYLVKHMPEKLLMLPPDRDVGYRELAEILEMNYVAVVSAVTQRRLPIRTVKAPRTEADVRKTVPAQQVYDELLKRQGSVHALRISRKRWQTLSQTLLIAHQNTFHSGRVTNPLLVEHLRYDQVRTWLSGAPGWVGQGGKKRQAVKSIYERSGIREPTDLLNPDGTPHLLAGQSPKMRTHQPRHWISTLAHKAGMSAFELTMWTQRADSRQQELYLHTSADYADLTRNRILDGELAGARVDQFNSLPPDRRSLPVLGVTAAHPVACGTCLADFTVDNCEFSKICPLCPLWLSDLKDERQRAVLQERRTNFAFALEQYESVQRQGGAVAQGTLRLYHRVVMAYDERLAKVA